MFLKFKIRILFIIHNSKFKIRLWDCFVAPLLAMTRRNDGDYFISLFCQSIFGTSSRNIGTMSTKWWDKTQNDCKILINFSFIFIA